MLRRRGRRKKSDIVTFSISEVNEKTVSFDGDAERKTKQSLDGKSISFGALDIVVHAAKEPTDMGFIKPPYTLRKTAKEEFKTGPENIVALAGSIDVTQTDGVLPELARSKRKSSRRQVNLTSPNVQVHGQPVQTCSDAACWWCCHKFDGRPAFLPSVYSEEHDSFKVYGNFCSWNCAKSYNYSSKGAKWSYRSMLLKFMVTKLQNKCICIRPAPPRDQLRFFGGEMSIDDFRDGNDKNFSTNSSGLVKMVSSFEEKALQNSRRAQYIN